MVTDAELARRLAEALDVPDTRSWRDVKQRQRRRPRSGGRLLLVIAAALALGTPLAAAVNARQNDQGRVPTNGLPPSIIHPHGRVIPRATVARAFPANQMIVPLPAGIIAKANRLGAPIRDCLKANGATIDIGSDHGVAYPDAPTEAKATKACRAVTDTFHAYEEAAGYQTAAAAVSKALDGFYRCLDARGYDSADTGPWIATQGADPAALPTATRACRATAISEVNAATRP